MGYSRLPFQLSASYKTGYDDNVTDDPFNKQSSAFSTLGLQLAYGFGSPRTQVSVQGGASGTYYWDHPSGGTAPGADQDYDINLNLELSVVHQASSRLTFSADLFGAYVSEPEFADQISTVYRNGNFFYAQDKVSVTYLWSPRFQTVNSYSLFALHYDDEAIGLFEDRFEHLFSDQFKFLPSSETALVLEYRFGLVDYSNEGAQIQKVHVFFGGYTAYQLLARNSLSNYVLGGFDHTFNPKLSVSLRGGVEFRDYYDFANNSVSFDNLPPGALVFHLSRLYETAPYFEGSLNYAAGKETTLTWTNRYGLEEPDIISNPVRTTYRTGLTVSHVFSDRISANAGVYFSHSYYHTGPDHIIINPFFGVFVVSGAPGFTEDYVELNGQVSYKVSRHSSIDLGYTYSTVDSDQSFREYDRNRVFGGFTYNF
jgi:hypothetical protein